MAKIIDLDDLVMSSDLANVGIDGNVWVDVLSKTITLAVFGNLSTDGVTLKALYSFITVEWRTTPALRKFLYALEPITDFQYELIRGWDFSNTDSNATRLLIRDAGWALKDSSGVSEEEYTNITTLSPFPNPGSDLAYFLQVDGGTPIDFELNGEVNQAVKVYGDASHGSFDYREFFKIFLREQGTTYATYDLITDQDVASLDTTKYGMPLLTNDDIKIAASDVYIAYTNLESTGVTFGVDKSIVTTDIDFTGLSAGDRIVVSGSASNDGTYTIALVNSSTDIDVEETLVSEIGATAVTIKSIHQSMIIKWFEDLVASASDLTFANGAGDTSTITSAADFDFGTEGYEIGHRINLSGCLTPANDGYYTIASVTNGVLELVGDNVFNTPQVDTGTPQINQARTVGTEGIDEFDYRIIITANQGTAEEIYEFIQWSLRQSGDIDNNGAVHNGLISDEMVQFIGETLETKLTEDGGIYIDDYQIGDTNRLKFMDDAGVKQQHPFIASVTIYFNINLQNSPTAIWEPFFSNDDAGDNSGYDFETINAIIVNDSDGNPLGGNIGGSPSTSFGYDYDGNIQRGAASAGKDAPLSVMAIGDTETQYAILYMTIERSVANVGTLTGAKDRTFSNPA